MDTTFFPFVPDTCNPLSKFFAVMPFAPLSPPLHNAVCRGVEFWHDKGSPVLCLHFGSGLSLAAIGHFPFFHPTPPPRCYSTRAHARFLRNVNLDALVVYYISYTHIYIYISRGIESISHPNVHLLLYNKIFQDSTTDGILTIRIITPLFRWLCVTIVIRTLSLSLC